MVLQETKELNRILSDKRVGQDVAYDTILLVKHFTKIYRNDKNRLNRKTIISLVITYLGDKLNEYGIDYWNKRLQKAITKFKDIPLYDVDFVPITKQELSIITSLNNKKMEKLLFVSLVYAKFFNLRKGKKKNQDYVNMDWSNIFKEARVSASTFVQPALLHELKEQGLIQRYPKFNCLNYRVTFIDDNDSSPVVMHITDLRELGYQYLERYGNKTDKFIRCAECGKIIRKKGNSTKYCKDCRGYTPLTIKTLTCIDCGKEFVVSGGNKRTCRCEECQRQKRLIQYKAYNKKRLSSNL